MKKILILISLCLIQSCGNNHDSNNSIQTYKSHIFNAKSGVLSYKGTMLVNLKCTNVYPNGSDWEQENVTVHNHSPSIELVKNKNCRIQLTQFIDNEKNVFKPANSDSPLMIDVNEDGSSVNSKMSVYSTEEKEPKMLYFASYSSEKFSIIINYSLDPTAAKIHPVIISVDEFKSDFSHIEPPVINNLQIVNLPEINKNKPQCTLYGSVENSSDCKVIKFNPEKYPTPINWEIANQQYNLKVDNVDVFECIKLNEVNNWDNFKKDEMHIIWSSYSKMKDFRSYSVASIIPK